MWLKEISRQSEQAAYIPIKDGSIADLNINGTIQINCTKWFPLRYWIIHIITTYQWTHSSYLPNRIFFCLQKINQFDEVCKQLKKLINSNGIN